MNPSLFSARVLTPHDARLSYPLMALRRPLLTLKNWQARLRAAHRSKVALLIGVLNPAGCMVAIAKIKGTEFAFLAEPPPLLGDARLLAQIAKKLASAMQPPEP